MNNKSKNIHKLNEIKRKLLKKATTQLTEKLINFCYDIVVVMKKIPISRKAFYELRHRLSSRPAESGAILLGPAGSNAITHFYYDRGGNSTATSYSPDYTTLNKKLRRRWRPAGLEIKGIAHSHGGDLNNLTYGDMRYIKRLMSRNPQMSMFVAPVVLPYKNSIHPMVICRDRMDYAQKAYFELF
ncbi:MAG: Mov34/MPN/PAD-1 family protein [Sedimentisphaerales bacterium]|nr:Mov34/MPN/PAD-1 family protein [Sedimentisphaerales bacterium]